MAKMSEEQRFLDSLEKLGPERVQQNLDGRIYHGQRERLAESFVEGMKREDEEAHRQGRVDRSAKQLGLREDPVQIAKRANWISVLAVLISFLALIRSCG